MTWFEAVVLGIVQGLTEFLPVSSSGHLAIVPKLAGWDATSVGFAVAVHVGTLVAVGGYFRRDLFAMFRGTARYVLKRSARTEADTEEQVKLLALLLAGSVPAAIAGLLLEDVVSGAFDDLRLVGGCLLVTALILWVSEGRSLAMNAREEGRDAASWRDALLVGCAQAFALLPGISRSGATIGTGLALGLKPERAARFALLLSVPVILGGGLLEALKLGSTGLLPGDAWCYALGMLVAAVSGWAAIVVVFRALGRGKLRAFSVYCGLVGLVSLVAGFLSA